MTQTTFMDVDGDCGFIDDLFSTEAEKWLPALHRMKSVVIGNNRQKHHLINLGVVPRLLHIMIEGNSSISMMTEAAIILGSLAKGFDESIACLLENGCVSVLLKGIYNQNQKYVDACLRCLRTLYDSTLAPVDAIYQDSSLIPHMLSIMHRTVTSQECVASILADCCKNAHHQTILCSSGIIAIISPLLSSDVCRILMAALKCLAGLSYQNQQVALAIAAATYQGTCLTQLMANLLARDKPYDVQMAAAKCLTYLCRVSVIHPQDNIIILKTLPTLIRLCKRQRSVEQRVNGAETLSYLISVNADLQKAAAITDHLIQTLAEFLKADAASGTPPVGYISNIDLRKAKEEIDADELRQSAFKVYAALGANDEAIRKKIITQVIDGENMMEHIVSALNSRSQSVQLASVRCLHSLSRSVQQLRTSFQDHAVWKPLMKILRSSPKNEEVTTLVSSTLCNLLLEFSPSKEPILEQGAVEILVELTNSDNPALRLNGIWALMNMAFSAEQKLKTQIIAKVGADRLFRLLSDSSTDVLMKTLGLLRNLLSNKPHIDHLMANYGQEIIQAVIMILEGDHSVEVKEQTLCILGNIADGDTARDYIMTNDDILKKLMNYMIHANVKLQTASTFCIANLVWNEEDGSLERQAKLRDMGVQKVLQQLLNTSDSVLFEKVKTALQQFT